MSVLCQSLTKKRRPCPNARATFDPVSGLNLCHLHHPEALFQRNVAENRRNNIRWRQSHKAKCRWCGGTYSQSRHTAVCVKHDVDLDPPLPL